VVSQGVLSVAFASCTQLFRAHIKAVAALKLSLENKKELPIKYLVHLTLFIDYRSFKYYSIVYLYFKALLILWS
jgi:hypothetical protein